MGTMWYTRVYDDGGKIMKVDINQIVAQNKQEGGIAYTLRISEKFPQQVEVLEGSMVKWYIVPSKDILHIYTVGEPDAPPLSRPGVHTVEGIKGGISIIIDNE